ncbi:hypothetical protein [Rosistilla oblonga]|uniref:hypothetical protein n=1 Tax=Rosistilla oblonga TaxID=2527990 RepID=UPI003A978A94
MTTETPESFNKSGSKYLRGIPCMVDGKTDVYAVIDAFGVTCPAQAHAIKKLLCPGQRGKGGTIQDLEESRDAITRAIQMAKQNEVHRSVKLAKSAASDMEETVNAIEDAVVNHLSNDPNKRWPRPACSPHGPGTKAKLDHDMKEVMSAIEAYVASRMRTSAKPDPSIVQGTGVESNGEQPVQHYGL